MRLPTTIASSPSTKPRPMNEAGARTPMANAAGTRFGVNHTVNSRQTAP